MLESPVLQPVLKTTRQGIPVFITRKNFPDFRKRSPACNPAVKFCTQYVMEQVGDYTTDDIVMVPGFRRKKAGHRGEDQAATIITGETVRILRGRICGPFFIAGYYAERCGNEILPCLLFQSSAFGGMVKFTDIVLGATGCVYQFRTALAKALLAPFLFYMLLDAAELLEPGAIASFGLSIAGIMVQTLFAITTHRVILLGPQAVPEWGLFDWSKREMMFALYLVSLGLILVPALLLLLVPAVGWALFLGLACWLVGRLSLVFPATAIDQGVSFKLSWELTRQHQILMILVVAVFPVILLLPAMLLSFLPYTFVLTSFLTTFSTVFTVAALSVAYKAICQEYLETE